MKTAEGKSFMFEDSSEKTKENKKKLCEFNIWPGLSHFLEIRRRSAGAKRRKKATEAAFFNTK